MRRRALRRVKTFVPWWMKMGAKAVMAHLPVDYKHLKRLGVVEYGRMDEPAYAWSTFREHCEGIRLEPGFSCLELGPGDSLYTALMAKALGAGRVYLVDARPIALRGTQGFRDMVAYLRSTGVWLDAEEPNFESVDEVLRWCNAEYRTEGLKSLREIEGASIDFAFSHAVLEHVLDDEMEPLVRELHRIIRPGGHTSHRVDLKDHLGAGLNHLRFSDRVWRSRTVRQSLFYTNRLRVSDVVGLFTAAGFEIETLQEDRWPALPMRRTALHERFRELSDEELLVHEVLLVCRRPH
jgi:SAM-dependent methyltransferase